MQPRPSKGARSIGSVRHLGSALCMHQCPSAPQILELVLFGLQHGLQHSCCTMEHPNALDAWSQHMPTSSGHSCATTAKQRCSTDCTNALCAPICHAQMALIPKSSIAPQPIDNQWHAGLRMRSTECDSIPVVLTGLSRYAASADSRPETGPILKLHLRFSDSFLSSAVSLRSGLNCAVVSRSMMCDDELLPLQFSLIRKGPHCQLSCQQSMQVGLGCLAWDSMRKNSSECCLEGSGKVGGKEGSSTEGTASCYRACNHNQVHVGLTPCKSSQQWGPCCCHAHCIVRRAQAATCR